MNLDVIVNELNKAMDEARASGDACTFGELKSIKKDVIRIIGNQADLKRIRSESNLDKKIEHLSNALNEELFG